MAAERDQPRAPQQALPHVHRLHMPHDWLRQAVAGQRAAYLSDEDDDV